MMIQSPQHQHQHQRQPPTPTQTQHQVMNRADKEAALTQDQKNNKNKGGYRNRYEASFIWWSSSIRNSKLFVNTYKESKKILTNRNFNVIIVNRKITSEEPNERFR